MSTANRRITVNTPATLELAMLARKQKTGETMSEMYVSLATQALNIDLGTDLHKRGKPKGGSLRKQRRLAAEKQNAAIEDVDESQFPF